MNDNEASEETPTIKRDAEGRALPGSKFGLENNGIQVGIRIISWQEFYPRRPEPTVLLTLRAPDDTGIMSGVWHWSTDHFLSTIYSELQTNLQHPCPCPEEVWDTFLQLAQREKLDQYFDLPKRSSPGDQPTDDLEGDTTPLIRVLNFDDPKMPVGLKMSVPLGRWLIAMLNDQKRAMGHRRLPNF